MNAWKAPDDLVVGDLVVTKDGANTRRVVGFGPRFNPRFRPTRFHDDPHYAADVDRDHDILVAVQAAWMVGPDGATDVVAAPAPLLGGEASPALSVSRHLRHDVGSPLALWCSCARGRAHRDRIDLSAA